MDCCPSSGIVDDLGMTVARVDARRYRKKGPDHTTQLLLDAIRTQDVEGMSLLDIGGGVGVIQHELIANGVKSVVSVEASESYIAVSKAEAERRGHSETIQQISGDFVELADKIARKDIVTLDRVICCYNDMASLVGLSTQRARKIYGVVYPKDHLISKVIALTTSFIHWMRRSDYREVLHSPEDVDDLIRSAGLIPFFDEQTLIWKVVVYKR